MHSVTKKFVVDPVWRIIIKDLGLNEQDLLRAAQLPLDLFIREGASVSATEYFRLWRALEGLLDNPEFPLDIGQAIPSEAFSPPLFATLCSPNLNSGLARLAKYKPLVGPMTLQLSVEERTTTVALGGIFEGDPVPVSFIAAELVFLTQLARMALRERIVPVAVHATADFANAEKAFSFFGREVQKSGFNGLVFAAEDARKPFLTANEQVWQAFEPELRKRMTEIDAHATTRERVRACLMEMVAGGECSISDVAKRLAVSSRTLQRRLQDENTNFQDELTALREELARHYLTDSKFSNAEIAFLLGYDDPNSFIRAFGSWTGTTPERVRATAVH